MGRADLPLRAGLEFGQVHPMLAETAPGPFDGPDWVFEVKWDGYRAVAFLAPRGEEGTTRRRTLLQSRRLKDLTPGYPELHRLDVHLAGRRAVVDGEIVALREGRPDFQALQAGRVPAVYVAFDLLELDGRVVVDRPLEERKALLAERLGSGHDLVHSAVVSGAGVSFYRAAVSEGLEGVVAKRLGSPYHLGRRSRDWLKVRNVHRCFVLACGYTRAADARPLGALVLGTVDPRGRLIYAGHAGTGFDQAEMGRLVAALGPPVACPLAGGEPRELRGRSVWVRPERVIEVEYLERTREGRLRHPVYRGLRPDKDADDCPSEGRP